MSPNTTRKKHRKKRRKRDTGIVSTVILVVAACVFAFSVYQLVRMIIPYYSGGREYDKIRDMAIASEEGEENGDDAGFRVDFEALRAENPDTVAWIRMEEPSVISYPVVKSKDNNEYLTRTFSANDNKLGAIFMDMRNNPSFTDRNTFIYGHNLKVGGEMFSQLNAYAEEAFCKQYPYFYIYTPDGKTRKYQVFSAGVVRADANNYKLTYQSEEEFLKYQDFCRSSSNYQVDVELSERSKIVSLSTCTNVNEEERFLLQGVLVESE